MDRWIEGKGLGRFEGAVRKGVEEGDGQVE